MIDLGLLSLIVLLGSDRYLDRERAEAIVRDGWFLSVGTVESPDPEVAFRLRRVRGAWVDRFPEPLPFPTPLF